METSKIFKTKTGYCHVLQDKIVLTRDGIIGNLAQVTTGNNIARPLIIYGLIAAGLLFLAIQEFNQGQTGSASVFIVFGLLLIFGIFKSLNNSATPVIDRQNIQDIEFKKAIPGLTPSHFIVHFLADNGKVKKRLILLPGSLTGGPVETEKALQIMKEEFGQLKGGG